MDTALTNIEVCADLRCEIDSCPLTIRSEGRTIVVEVPDVASGLKVLQLSLPRGSRRRRLHAVKTVLDRLASVLEVRVAGRTCAQIGYHTGSRWWRLLGLPAISLSPIHAVLPRFRD